MSRLIWRNNLFFLGGGGIKRELASYVDQCSMWHNDLFFWVPAENLKLSRPIWRDDYFFWLSINFNKTEYMVVTTKHNKPELKVSIDNNPIKQSHHIKYPGVLIDDNLTWKQQIKEQCSKVGRGSWALNQLKHSVDEQTLRSVYHCLIYSHPQYCISSWGTASKSTLAPLFILQKRSIRLLTGSGYRKHTNPLFYRAKCLKLKDIYSLETAKLMYKIHDNVLSFANSDKFNLIKNCYTHETR